MAHQAKEHDPKFAPPYPALIALAFCMIWIAVLSLPMWEGLFLASPVSDQYATGYAWRHWQAQQWKELGHIPLWNPGIFGGLPYVAAMHGDIFYPTAWLRLALPTAFAMNLGFVVHYVLAGLFAYLFLRRLQVSWAGSVVGALAFQLSGVIGTYVHPGHDGKLYVTALLPLALLALLMAVRDRRFEGYGLLALVVGLSLLSPHPQMAQYMLIAAGLFTLYLTFGERTDRSVKSRIADLGLALGAVALGFGIGAIQLWPFFEYIPFSPRAESYRGWEGATSFAIPWVHVPEFFLSKFVGQSADGTYWGTNPAKLHSEYLGLSVVALASLGIGTKRRRLALWLGGIGLLFLLVALGASTPFYRLWYEVVPFVKQTRAAGMALYIVALVVAVFAALGVERLQRGEGRRHAMAWLVIAGAVIVLGAVGAFGGFAVFLAQGIQQASGVGVAGTAAAASSQIRLGAVASGVALGLVGALAFGALTGRVKMPLLCLGLAVIVSADLWFNVREFWVFSNGHEELHGSDEVTGYITATEKPYRVLCLAERAYPGSSLQSRGIPQLLGHHGNELHRFDELMGGKNVWRYLFSGDLKLLELYSVRHVIIPPGSGIEQAVPGFEDRYRRAMSGAETSGGGRVDVYTAVERPPYGRLVPAGVRLTDEQAINTILNPEFPPDQLVLLSPESSVDLPALSDLPEPLGNEVVFETWEPGAMRIRIEPPAPQDGFLVVSENWYPDWNSTVDGSEAPVVRGDMTLITVPVAAGSEMVELRFESSAYHRGKTTTFLSLFLVLLAIFGPRLVRRKADG